MKPSSVLPFFNTAILCGALAFSSGCSEDPKHLPELSINQIAEGAPEAFRGAPAEVGQLAADAANAIAAEDHPTAWEKLQALQASPDLTPAQRDFVAQSITAVSQALEAAEAAGNEAAQQLREFHRANK
jgi:hypothetical protein